jgi:predicted unusual protein kinase regulating ubiquinone biosynthesis (AarF/ABC1/UbiB family)
VDELDYTREAANAERFTASLANTPLKGAVFAPQVHAPKMCFVQKNSLKRFQ